MDWINEILQAIEEMEKEKEKEIQEMLDILGW